MSRAPSAAREVIDGYLRRYPGADEQLEKLAGMSLTPDEIRMVVSRFRHPETP